MADAEHAEGAPTTAEGVQDLTAMVQNLLQKMVRRAGVGCPAGAWRGLGGRAAFRLLFFCFWPRCQRAGRGDTGSKTSSSR